jgi:hypothetical protein
LGLLDQDTPPKRFAVDCSEGEQVHVDTVWDCHDPRTRHTQQRNGAVNPGWCDDEPRAVVRPASDPLRPTFGVSPIGPVGVRYSLEHQ